MVLSSKFKKPMVFTTLSGKLNYKYIQKCVVYLNLYQLPTISRRVWISVVNHLQPLPFEHSLDSCLYAVCMTQVQHIRLQYSVLHIFECMAALNRFNLNNKIVNNFLNDVIHEEGMTGWVCCLSVKRSVQRWVGVNRRV